MKFEHTEESPWAKLDALLKFTPEPVGPEWFTVQEFANRYGITKVSAGMKLRGLFNAGKFDRWEGVAAVTKRLTVKYRLKSNN